MAHFSEEVRGATVSLSNMTRHNGDGEASRVVSYDEIAGKLLSEKLVLTALELHAELSEAGKEIPTLRDFFANPNNFEDRNIKPEPYTPMPRSCSQATLDSIDMTRYSEDGGGLDEKVAVLEFELRKARENISALRANLTVVTESESSIINADKSSAERLSDSPIKPHEERALNLLVYEYLLARSYKLTSITFSDENEDQDLEDWEDVGLDIPKPPDLIRVYREFCRSNGYDKSTVDVSLQTDTDATLLMRDEIEKLRREKCELEQRVLEATTNLALPPSRILDNSNSTTPEKFELLERAEAAATPQVTPEPEEVDEEEEEEEEEEDTADSVSAVVSLVDTDPGDKDWTRIQLPRVDLTAEESSNLVSNSPRQLPSEFRGQVLSLHRGLTAQSSHIDHFLVPSISRDTLPTILARSLPKIVPNVILDKREELIPLIVGTVRLQSESGEREKLLRLLFNLKKRPNDVERSMILAGSIAMAKLQDASSTRHSEEILGVCWEHSRHKYPERRLLAAECCLALAPYTSSGIRNSLMLPMLQQMLLDDKESVVRATVVRSLGFLVALIDDPDKYFQCEELALTALDDGSADVVEAASTTLVPILAQWALSLQRLQSHLLPRIIQKIKSLARATKPRRNAHHRRTPTKDDKEGDRIVAHVNVLEQLLPHSVIFVAQHRPIIVGGAIALSIESPIAHLTDEFMRICRSGMADPKIFSDDFAQTVIHLNAFFANTWDTETWQELQWLTDKLVPDLLDILRKIDVVAQETVLKALLSYLESLCIAFGQRVARSKIQRTFELRVNAMEKRLMALASNDDDGDGDELALVAAQLTLLSRLDVARLGETFKQLVIVLSMSGASIDCLRFSVTKLCLESPVAAEHIVAALWDGVVHQRSSVRCTTAELFGCAVVRVIDEKLTISRIAPAIVTLANDTDLTVRAAAIPALGRLVTECGAREVRDKGRLTLETIARESSDDIPAALALPLVSTLAKIAPDCPQHFNEEVVAGQLMAITITVAINQSRARAVEIANALVEAYSTLVYCSLSNRCILAVVLPGLAHLENLVDNVLPQQKETVRSLICEIEARNRQTPNKLVQRSAGLSASVLSPLSLANATANVGQGVEDMRQRMSKIFIQKSSSSLSGGGGGMSSIFRKK